jgi:hypothetical protein
MHPVAGPFQDTHLSKGCHALFSRRVLFLDTSSLTDSLGPILALGSVSMPRLWISLGNLKIPSSPGTVFTDAAFPRRASLPSERQLCHCKNRAAPIGTCLDGRQLAGRPGLAPNHNSKPGRPKPTCRRSRALAYPRAQLRNVKSAAGRPPQGLTTQPYRLRLFSWPFSPLCLLAPLSHPWRSHTSSCYHPPRFKELVREPMHYRLRLTRTTDSARHRLTHPHTPFSSRLAWLLGLETTILVPHPQLQHLARCRSTRAAVSLPRLKPFR